MGAAEVVFEKQGHFWMDSGLVGLIKTLESMKPENITYEVRENRLILKGNEKDVQDTIMKAYYEMTNQYYNLSSQKQKEEKSSYNFYYDEKTDQFVDFPKRKAMGIAELIFNKAPRPVEGMIKWEKTVEKEITFQGKKMKKKRGILPKKYSHLQARMEEFLDSKGIDVTTSGLLLNSPYAIRPKFSVNLSSKKVKGTCYLCGQPSSQLEEVNQTIFPMITGTSGVLSFYSNADKPEKACWKCSLLGKFVPVNGFYMYQGDSLYAFLPYSNSLDKMLHVYDLMQNMKEIDPNLFKNFNHDLGSYYQHSFEITFTFLYTLYDRLLVIKKKNAKQEDEYELDLQAMFNLVIHEAPLEFMIIHAQKEGNTYAVKMCWPFKDTVYLFRLLERIEKGTGVRMKGILGYLLDYHAPKDEAKSFLRNRLLERMMNKESILDLVEKHVYGADIQGFKPLLDMLVIYETTLREGDILYKEQQEAAVKLGRIIGMAVANSENGKKGDLFSLRKTRKMADFLEQINRLQFKLGDKFIVPSDIYEGKLTEDNFFEFKQFCMISALNSYYYATKKEKNE